MPVQPVLRVEQESVAALQHALLVLLLLVQATFHSHDKG
jgi:hypothetical protein